MTHIHNLKIESRKFFRVHHGGTSLTGYGWYHVLTMLFLFSHLPNIHMY